MFYVTGQLGTRNALSFAKLQYLAHSEGLLWNRMLAVGEVLLVQEGLALEWAIKEIFNPTILWKILSHPNIL